MRQRYRVALSAAQRAQLHTLIGCGEAPARQLTHARIVRKANQGDGGPGGTAAAMAGALAGDPRTVVRVRQRSASAGLEAARDRQAPDRV